MPQHRFTSLAKSADARLQNFDKRYAEQRENFISRSANRLMDAWLALPVEVRERFNELLDRQRERGR